MMKSKATDKSKLYKVLSPAVRFFETEQSSGILLIAVAVIAIIWANSPLSGVYFELWEKTLSFGFGEFRLEKTFTTGLTTG